MRDETGLDAALARPRNLWAYDPTVDLADLAAAYGFGLCRGHPFADGNKRVAFVTMIVFLGLNGLAFTADEDEVVVMIRRLAAGQVSQIRLADWLRSKIAPIEGGAE